MSIYRPISNLELIQTRDAFRQRMRLGNVIAVHHRCKHRYRTRVNGRKEKQILETGKPGNCSVCWKFGKADRHTEEYVWKLVRDYNRLDHSEISVHSVDTEIDFYRWLYSV